MNQACEELKDFLPDMLPGLNAKLNYSRSSSSRCCATTTSSSSSSLDHGGVDRTGTSFSAAVAEAEAKQRMAAMSKPELLAHITPPPAEGAAAAGRGTTCSRSSSRSRSSNGCQWWLTQADLKGCLTPKAPESGSCDHCQGVLHASGQARQGQGLGGSAGDGDKAQLCPRCLVACYCSDKCRVAAAAEHRRMCR